MLLGCPLLCPTRVVGVPPAGSSTDSRARGRRAKVRTLRNYCEQRRVELLSLIPETFLCVPGGGLADERATLAAAEDAEVRWVTLRALAG